MKMEEDYWKFHPTEEGELSDETKALVLRDRQQFWTWWRFRGYQDNEDAADAGQEPVLFEQANDPNQRTQAYVDLGWDVDSPAFQVAFERGLSAESATAVLRDYGARPPDACSMDGAQFAARFGQSWFEILPRING